eukprot:m.320086 g.320086  ORF g.320086 m.320086 type:complete len:638 (+) comp15992_c3_seq4:451-2364(+)
MDRTGRNGSKWAQQSTSSAPYSMQPLELDDLEHDEGTPAYVPQLNMQRFRSLLQQQMQEHPLTTQHSSTDVESFNASQQHTVHSTSASHTVQRPWNGKEEDVDQAVVGATRDMAQSSRTTRAAADRAADIDAVKFDAADRVVSWAINQSMDSSDGYPPKDPHTAQSHSPSQTTSAKQQTLHNNSGQGQQQETADSISLQRFTNVVDRLDARTQRVSQLMGSEDGVNTQPRSWQTARDGEDETDDGFSEQALRLIQLVERLSSFLEISIGSSKQKDDAIASISAHNTQLTSRVQQLEATLASTYETVTSLEKRLDKLETVSPPTGKPSVTSPASVPFRSQAQQALVHPQLQMQPLVNGGRMTTHPKHTGTHLLYPTPSDGPLNRGMYQSVHTLAAPMQQTTTQSAVFHTTTAAPTIPIVSQPAYTARPPNTTATAQISTARAGADTTSQHAQSLPSTTTRPSTTLGAGADTSMPATIAMSPPPNRVYSTEFMQHLSPATIQLLQQSRLEKSTRAHTMTLNAQTTSTSSPFSLGRAPGTPSQIFSTVSLPTASSAVPVKPGLLTGESNALIGVHAASTAQPIYTAPVTTTANHQTTGSSYTSPARTRPQEPISSQTTLDRVLARLLEDRAQLLASTSTT